MTESESSPGECNDCKDFELLVDLMKEKCKVSSRREKIKLLTLVPDSWSATKVMETFGASNYMVRQARKLKREKGILAEPDRKAGRQVTGEMKKKTTEFYESDEFSRTCPGQKDYVTVQIEGQKIQKQKRLLLTNLNEMYCNFKTQNQEVVGFSKFCELRPKWCIPVGPKGTHSVCVCQYHQNAKLLVAALPVNTDYKILL